MIVDSPLVLVRDSNGKARLFLKSCRHRGVKVCEGAGTDRSNFTCPFHNWRYDLDGNLVNVPEPEGFDDLDRDAHGLIELPMAEKYGLLFGKPTPGGKIDVDVVLGGLGPELVSGTSRAGSCTPTNTFIISAATGRALGTRSARTTTSPSCMRTRSKIGLSLDARP
jgi:phenylpropionate dioxygenase-like ring-hydroxylating dioxygenase large terminal subunit